MKVIERKFEDEKPVNSLVPRSLFHLVDCGDTRTFMVLDQHDETGGDNVLEIPEQTYRRISVICLETVKLYEIPESAKVLHIGIAETVTMRRA